MASIRAPFGGLNLAPAQRNISERDCVDCLNVHTSFGSIVKRPGLRLVTTSGFAIGVSGLALGIKSFRIGGNGYLAFKAAAAGQRAFIVNADGVLVMTTSCDGTSTIGVSSAYNRLYLAGGSTLRTVYLSGSTLVEAPTGITAPAAAPALAGGGAGAMAAGTYSYRLTYYNSTLGVESGPSPAAEVTIGASEQVVVGPTVASADAQVSHVRVYRRRNTVDATWFYVGQVTDGGTYFDNAASVTGLESDALNVIADLPPASNILCWHQRRMWWGLARSVRASEIDKPERVNPLGGYATSDSEGDFMVEMVSAFGMLLVFNLNSIWAITGNGLNTYSARKIIDGIGCAGRGSIVLINGWLYWADRQGVYRWSGSGFPECISSAIEPLWRSIYHEGFYADTLTAGYDPLSACYILSGRGLAGEYTRQLAFSTRALRWYEWGLGASGFALFPEVVGRQPRLHTVRMVGPDEFRLHMLDNQDFDSGAAGNREISWNWKTANLDFGTLRDKQFFAAAPAWEQAASEGLFLEAGVNHGALASLGSVPMNGSRQRRPFYLGRIGNTLQLRLTGSSQAVVRIAAIDVDLEAVGFN